MKTPNTYEAEIWKRQLTCIGIDEAGRGPIAGPLVVAGVVFPIGYDTGEIYDSKKLSERKRNELFRIIIRDALYYDIRIVTPEVIDRENIYRATQHTMADIAAKAPVFCVITDAMPLAIDKEVTAVIKGDQISGSVAAGSILAKVVRDHIMKGYDVLYPQYGFAKHKGYPTKAHLEALQAHGVLPIHRKSYRPVSDLLQPHLIFD